MRPNLKSNLPNKATKTLIRPILYMSFPRDAQQEISIPRLCWQREGYNLQYRDKVQDALCALDTGIANHGDAMRINILKSKKKRNGRL